MNIAKLIKASAIFVENNKAAIIAGLSVMGVVSTAKVAYETYPKHEVIRKELVDADTKTLVVEGVKAWAPLVVTVVGTSAGIIAVHYIHEKDKAALAGGAAAIAEAYRKYRETVEDNTDSKVLSKIKDEYEEKTTSKGGSNVYISDDQKHVFVETYSGSVFKSTINKIDRAVNEANREINEQGCISYNDFRYLLGLERSDLGFVTGFNVGTPVDIIFGSDLDKNKTPTVTISYRNDPHHDYDKYQGR